MRLDAMLPIRIGRVALVAPTPALRAMLVQVADSGVVQLDPAPHDTEVAADRQLGWTRGVTASTRPTDRPPESSVEVSTTPPDLDRLAGQNATALLTGEAQVQRFAAAATHRNGASALLGWCPLEQQPELASRLASVGAALVPLPTPKGVLPPTLLRPGGPTRRSFGMLVRTYGTVPYRDLDPTLPAGVGYALMFGMMFGDAGHGLMLFVAALVLASRRIHRPAVLVRLAGAWPFLAAAGAAGVAFGVLYGEFFGPTGFVPVVWLSPLRDPVRLLTAAVGVGVVLLAVAYAAGVVNRWREGGPRLAVYSANGIAGVLLFTGLLTAFAGVDLHLSPVRTVGLAVTTVGMLLTAAGFLAAAGGGLSGLMQAGVQLFDTVVRLASNVVSFTRLAAFGLTHAALGLLVWRGTVALGRRGVLGVAVAGVFFVVGTALTFALEALIAGVQALRLEYYELFSRVFQAQGHPFQPWKARAVTAPAGEQQTSATTTEAST